MNSNFSHLSLLFKRLLLAYAVFSLTRLLFFLFNFEQFHTATTSELFQSFFAGLLFDTSAIVYLFGFFILLHAIPINTRDKKWYQGLEKWYFIVVIALSSLLNIIDTGYYPFGGKRWGTEIIYQKNDIADQSLSYLISYWYLFLIWVGIIFFTLKLYPKLLSPQKISSLKQFAYEFIVLIFIIGFCVLGARGGWNLKPINSFDAARLASPKLINLTINTPFQILVSSQQIGLEEKHYLNDEEALDNFNPIHLPAPDSSYKNKNIILIIVESLGKEYVGYYNHGKGYTPFLDSLMNHSTVYMHAYANGKRSIEGIPSIVAAIPSLMGNDYVSSRYQSNKLRSIGDYLQETGYNTSFYHGGKNGTMGFDNFIAVSNAGIYYGLNEYPDMKRDFDGNWGIYDEPYLQYFAKELDKKPQPFFSTVFTLSSHHPYNIPADKQHLFSGGPLFIHKSIQYADYSLRRFFEAAEQMPWYKNTVFIITADHSAENEFAYYQTQQGKYEIPLVIYIPHGKHITDTCTTQQIDILPKIVEKVYGKPFFSFGNNRLNKKDCSAIQYYNSIYQLIQWPYVYQFDGEKAIGFYDMRTDSLMQKNLLEEKKGNDQLHQMDTFLKSYIQQYNNNIIRNKTALN